MTSNRLHVVPGTTAEFVVDLTTQQGVPLASDSFTGISATLLLREDPTGADVLKFQSPDAARLVFNALTSQLAITFLIADTNTLVVGTPYFWQLEVTFASGEIDIAVEWSPVDVDLGGSAAPTPPTFNNTIKVNHDFPLSDDLRYITAGGSPIADAQVRMYLKADYDAGRLESPVGITMTKADGRWATTLLAVPGYSYVVRFEKPNEFGPNITTIVAV